jgi:hypothetical protein
VSPLSPVPGDERTRGAERCSVHAAAASVATCDGCGRELCLSCAIPVRGRILGVECLASALGPDAPVPLVEEREPGWPARRVAAVAFAAAVIATVLPWSRFGRGAEVFGAWGTTPSWSVLVAVAAVAGLAASLLFRVWPHLVRTSEAMVAVAAVVVVAGSILALARPPAFTSPWLGPWVALGAGLAASGASFAFGWEGRRRAVHP